MFHSAQLAVGAIGGNLVKPGSVVAVRPQSLKTLIGAQVYVLNNILYIRRSISAPILSHNAPKLGKDFVVMSFDQLLKAKRHLRLPGSQHGNTADQWFCEILMELGCSLRSETAKTFNLWEAIEIKLRVRIRSSLPRKRKSRRAKNPLDPCFSQE